MLVIVYLLICVVLILAVVAGLTANIQKKVKTWLMVSRILYLILLITSGVRLFYSFPVSPVMAVVKIILTILLVLCVELSFTKKQEEHVTVIMSGCLVLLFILNLLVNYYL